MEVWKDIKGYEGRYQVSNKGRVKSLPKRRGRGVGYMCEENILKPTKHHHGYFIVNLRANGKGTTIEVHRLVAKAFICNPDNKPQINHINGIKTDNRTENLEWCTNGENQLHKYRVIGHKPYGKPVICVETKQEYSSALVAAKCNGIDSSSIAKCCREKRQMVGGYHWKYKGA
jgi:hypothetical protein